ncbi:hypothetical protein [Flammeovirga aprica]|uniref:Uncharacterized protein n=1 Tax=Flammeovirga aprica JL-4 TaxID=694437 RepID=A0A7X9S224_9BACT|nr:hypothetical protein [Flammeovirga aprica]NME72960.1 hypothetical protein [Flammeovirga aprica JL-4]
MHSDGTITVGSPEGTGNWKSYSSEGEEIIISSNKHVIEDYVRLGGDNPINKKLSFSEKSKLFLKKDNALLTYVRDDGIIYMHRAPSNKDLPTGLADELTFSFKYKTGNNTNSKDVFGTIGLSDEGYLVGNLKKTTGMNNQQIKRVSEDALDMSLHHYTQNGNEVKGIKALWVKNSDLYPNLPDNKSINLIRFENALEKMDKTEAAFETVTGSYSKSRDFKRVLEIKKFTELEDGFYGYEIIFGK